MAHKCESLFHGVSSGVDVAAVMSAEPIVYVQNQPVKKLKSDWQPALYLSQAAQGSKNYASCGNNRNISGKATQTKQKALCEQMQEASNMVLESFVEHDFSLEDRQAMLKNGIKAAQDCFIAWGLINGTLKDHIDLLVAHGATAVKPTGSGGEGGHVISLWSNPIPDKLQAVLHPIFKK